MRVLAGAFVLATLMDLVTFLRMVDVAGLEAERNVLAVRLAEQGVAFAIAAKLLVLVAGLAVAAAIDRIGKYRAVGELVLVVGILVGAFGAGANVTLAATPWSAMQPAPSTSGVDGHEKGGARPSAAAWRTGAPLPTVTPGPLVRTPEPTGTGAAADGVTLDPDPSGVVSSRNGVASWMPERYGHDYLALPEGPGVHVRICGAGGCEAMRSTDAGPDLAMQRAGRIADIGVRAWERICGIPRSIGLCRVTVEVLA